MPQYKRAHVHGCTYFFTVVSDRRRKIFADPVACRLLCSIVRRGQDRWPLEMTAVVLLPDHLHAIWSLPPGGMLTTQNVGAGGPDSSAIGAA